MHTKQILAALLVITALFIQSCGPNAQSALATTRALRDQQQTATAGAGGGGEGGEFAVATETPTSAPIANNWDGSWDIWVDGSHYTTVISQTGSSFSGSFVTGVDTVTYSGSLSADQQVATGTYTVTTGASGDFQWQLNPDTLDQFAGSVISGVATAPWCGARGGASEPDPCLWP